MRQSNERKELDLDVDATISLNVWLDEGNPELLGGDWDHLSQKFVRRLQFSTKGASSCRADSFDVDGTGIHFRVD